MTITGHDIDTNCWV